MRVLVAVACVLAAVVTAVAQDAKAPDGMTPRTKKQPRLTRAATAPMVLAACRSMLPTNRMELTGALILRNRKGIVQKEFAYRLQMQRGEKKTSLSIDLSEGEGPESKEVASVKIERSGNTQPTIQFVSGGETKVIGSPLERVLGTDVTWLDLTFDFLWWTDAQYETAREGETVHGQKCMVILVRPPEKMKIAELEAVRLWVEKGEGCLMQAEQLGEGLKPIRRRWGTRVKKFGNHWMVSVLEVEELGSRHRTKITVDTLQELEN